MKELVQLQQRHEDFAKRGVRVVVVSMEGADDAKQTQQQFLDLLVLADSGRGLSTAAGLIHEKAAPDGKDIDMPTTILVDRTGVVRWIYRSPTIIARLSPDEVVRGVEEHMAKKGLSAGERRT